MTANPNAGATSVAATDESASDAATSPDHDDVLIEVRNLTKHFPITGGLFKRQVGAVRAVDGVSFDIRRGETLGLVGESGSGKTTTGRVILQLHTPTDGTVKMNDVELTELSKSELRALRPHMQIIFQDPQASLNPRMTVGSIISEPLREHGVGEYASMEAAVAELLTLVGLDPTHANRYPHEFSGGQRQRIGIARAIALNPEFIVCDEAIAALDVSIQAQVVNLLKQLQGDLGLTYLFISHDLSMVHHIADRIAVMYLGKLVELAGVQDLHANPRHPYTAALHSAVPVPDPVAEQLRQRTVLEGDIPSPSNPPSGCVFRTRCPKAEPHCAKEVPEWQQIADDHWVACHFPN